MADPERDAREEAEYQKHFEYDLMFWLEQLEASRGK